MSDERLAKILGDYETLDEATVAEKLGIRTDTLRRLIEDREFPPGIQTSPRTLMWLVKDVVSYLWLKSRGVKSLAGPGARKDQKKRPEVPFVPYDGSVPACVSDLLGQLTDKWLGSAVYFLIDFDEVVYIGSSVRPMVRIQEHASGVNGTEQKSFTLALMLPVDEKVLLDEERRFIGLVNPKLNTAYRTN